MDVISDIPLIPDIPRSFGPSASPRNEKGAQLSLDASVVSLPEWSAKRTDAIASARPRRALLQSLTNS